MKITLLNIFILITLTNCKSHLASKNLYYVVYNENKTIIDYKVHKVIQIKQDKDKLYQKRKVYTLNKDFKHTKTTVYNEIVHKGSALLRKQINKKDTIYKPYLHLSDTCTNRIYNSEFGKLMSYRICYLGQKIASSGKKNYRFTKLLAPDASHPIEFSLLVDEDFELIQEDYRKGYGYHYNLKRLEKNIPLDLLNFMKNN